MKRIIGITVATAVLLSGTPVQAAGSGVTRAGCITIDREWLTVKRNLAGIEALYKVPDVAVALQQAATVWTNSAVGVRQRGGIKVAAALTTAATAARGLRKKLLKGDAKGALTLSKRMSQALEKTVLPACAALF